MMTPLYWISGISPGRLAILPRPRGGDWLEDEVRAWKRANVDIVVSLLTAEEEEELGLDEESRLCQAEGIEFLSFPVPDREVPAVRDAAVAFIRNLAGRLAEGKSIAVHCRAGVGRSALIAAGILVVAGDTPEEALRRVSAARGVPVPETREQREWVERLSRAPVGGRQSV